MAALESPPPSPFHHSDPPHFPISFTFTDPSLSSYLGLSFALSLCLLPRHAHHAERRLRQAEHQLAQLRSRRQEDSKANARVVEIFASHRNAWQAEERRLVRQIEESKDEIMRLRARAVELEGEVEELRREVAEREEMLNFMSASARTGLGLGEEGISGEFYGGEERERDVVEGEFGLVYGEVKSNGFDSNLFGSASKFWAERAHLWQGVQYEALEPVHHTKHFVARRESPWKVDVESTGVPAKLKLLEQELMNLEKIGKSDISKLSSLMRKQAKRYQDLAAKIDDLCTRMQMSDPCDPTLTSELRTQRQTEFLLEAFRLQQRSSETGQKLMTLQTEVNNNPISDHLSRSTTKRSMDTIKNNLKEMQRNLEIWLARIIGDLEGILARDGASRARDYYSSSRYPYV